MDKYLEVLQQMAKSKPLEERLKISPEHYALIEDMGIGATGTIKDTNGVINLLSKDVEALRSGIEKRNSILKANEPQGKIIQTMDGSLKDIRQAQIDLAKGEEKSLQQEASKIYQKVRGELESYEKQNKDLSPGQIA